ncbi:sucrase ferredoxin [Agrobacterium sp.]|uniref:sucrase ferredoxin n=1 Tax=Agrobacterium sp. TaxID=361 RepID=UPI0028AB1AE6|nr:sucrase ferredoxin [Agrobacterium sp.]
MARIFCRDLCIERGEPAPGLGPSSRSYVLLHWPRGDWRVPRITSHGMTPALADAIVAANAAGIHVALVDGDDIGFTHQGIVRNHVTPDEAADLLQDITRGGTIEGELDPRQTIVCCTDGKQDPCCARYGFATWKALRQAADPARFRILQSTHLGGCRFAASLVVLPQRARYSRLEPTQVEEFLACLEKGMPYLAAYRGNPALSAPEQMAEFAVLSWAAQRGVTGDVSLSTKDHADAGSQMMRYGATVGASRMTVVVEKADFDVNTRCVTIPEPEGTKSVARWVVTSVVAEN